MNIRKKIKEFMELQDESYKKSSESSRLSSKSWEVRNEIVVHLKEKVHKLIVEELGFDPRKAEEGQEKYKYIYHSDYDHAINNVLLQVIQIAEYEFNEDS